MKLNQLLTTLETFVFHGDAETEITNITCDSRNIIPGSLFVALRGSAVDGHHFIDAAASSGAAAIVLDDPTFAPTRIPWVRVDDGRGAMARMASEFYGNPTANLPLIGITGTNGKTTTTYVIEGILRAAGIPAAVLGTTGYRFNDTIISASHTTPESTDLQAVFRKLADAGAKAFVMEVSSHALEQKRVDGCHFDVGIFSNLTRDHLDYHATMENYLQAKLRFFSEILRSTSLKSKRWAAVNMDDERGAIVAEHSACPVISFGLEQGNNVRADNASLAVDGISGTLITPKGTIDFSSPLLGKFNLSNILAAASAGIALDLPLEAIKTGIEKHPAIPGRMERVKTGRGFTVLVDYAHTGDALRNVLNTLRELKPRRIVTMFGCGGDRDRGKRPIMGNVAVSMSDFTIITCDNPRTEDPRSIMEHIREGAASVDAKEFSAKELAGLSVKNFTAVVEKGFALVESRREAIRLAVRMARSGDIVLLAGKGHEDYQIIGKKKHHFSDCEEAKLALAELDS